jgi:hypothetical protein
MTTETVVAQVGATKVLVESVPVDVPESVGSQGRYGVEKTSRDLRDAYAQLKDLLGDVASDMGAQLASPDEHWPNEITVEFGLSFSAEGNVWVIKARGDMTCKVTMTWQKPTDLKPAEGTEGG